MSELPEDITLDGAASHLLTCITHLSVQRDDLWRMAVIFRTCLSDLTNGSYCHVVPLKPLSQILPTSPWGARWPRTDG